MQIIVSGVHRWDTGTITGYASSSMSGTRVYTYSVCRESGKETINPTGNPMRDAVSSLSRPQYYKIVSGHTRARSVAFRSVTALPRLAQRNEGALRLILQYLNHPQRGDRQLSVIHSHTEERTIENLQR